MTVAFFTPCTETYQKTGSDRFAWWWCDWDVIRFKSAPMVGSWCETFVRDQSAHLGRSTGLYRVEGVMMTTVVLMTICATTRSTSSSPTVHTLYHCCHVASCRDRTPHPDIWLEARVVTILDWAFLPNYHARGNLRWWCGRWHDGTADCKGLLRLMPTILKYICIIVTKNRYSLAFS